MRLLLLGKGAVSAHRIEGLSLLSWTMRGSAAGVRNVRSGATASRRGCRISRWSTGVASSTSEMRRSEAFWMPIATKIMPRNRGLSRASDLCDSLRQKQQRRSNQRRCCGSREGTSDAPRLAASRPAAPLVDDMSVTPISRHGAKRRPAAPHKGSSPRVASGPADEPGRGSRLLRSRPASPVRLHPASAR
jgi:hypothetical protein